MEPENLIYRYWGKASRGDEHFHLLVYHSLDVAAVGDQLLKHAPMLLQQLSSLLGLNTGQTRRWMRFFLAMHDCGKFTDSFQNLRPDILVALQQRSSPREYPQRHDTLGYWLWHEVIKQECVKLGMLKAATARQPSTQEQAIDFWWRAVTGHHGQPPESSQNFLSREVWNEPQDRQAVIYFLHAIRKLFQLDETEFPCLAVETMRQASWWIAGFTVLCDWLGSSRCSDDFVEQAIPLETYWQQAKIWAKQVIEHNEILPAQVVKQQDISSLFPSSVSDKITLTPLQQAAQSITLGEAPQLFILEDVTGAGKTEAAMILLQKLMSGGQSNGFYFGLPSMATANAMYQRMADVYRSFFNELTEPSLVLAHSASRLNESYRQSFTGYNSDEDSEQGDGTQTASAHCSQWLTDNRKKALLAEVGIGTIDQALLAILPSRHQSLRLFGLLGKTLIVDEVHACDAYMNTLLSQLLKAHSLAGGSAILLSATLPQLQRQQLMDAFLSGLHQPPKALKKTAFDQYPLMTQLSASTLNEIRVATRDSVKRKVLIETMEHPDHVYEYIDSALQQGQCVCWIRNTVNDARSAYHYFQQHYPEHPIQLFHARFAMGDRLKKENAVLHRFGNESDAAMRCGQLLIATQVVEQSLDLDFDLMVTDLAPIDLLIQRAGRLCRHQRDVQGNRIQTADQRATPKLIIHCPPWQDEPDANWLKSAMPGTAAVYQTMDGLLWQGLKLLREKGEFRMPQDARRLIEGVYAEQILDDLPQGLIALSLDQQAEEMAKKGQGRMNRLNLEQGYDKTNQNIWWDEASTPTRLGEESTMVYLARWKDEILMPWFGNGNHRWANSSLSMRQAVISQECIPTGIPQTAVEAIKQQLPAQGKFGVLLILTQCNEDSWEGMALNVAGEEVVFYYDEIHGLTSERERGA
jgi:CRISPR-associated endonuclease/helicase Cas3